MKKLAFAFAVVAVGAAGLAVAHEDDDHDHDGPRCRHERYVIIDAPTKTGCASPFGFCAAGFSFGTLHASTFFSLDGFSPAPATAPGRGETSGLLVYTFENGDTLTVRETGAGNLKGDGSGGFGASFEEVVAGTGRYEGATGLLFLASTAANGFFHADVQGDICR